MVMGHARPVVMRHAVLLVPSLSDYPAVNEALPGTRKVAQEVQMCRGSYCSVHCTYSEASGPDVATACTVAGLERRRRTKGESAAS
jgi:hypothetical protein